MLTLTELKQKLENRVLEVSEANSPTLGDYLQVEELRIAKDPNHLHLWVIQYDNFTLLVSECELLLKVEILLTRFRTSQKVKEAGGYEPVFTNSLQHSSDAQYYKDQLNLNAPFECVVWSNDAPFSRHLRYFYFQLNDYRVAVGHSPKEQNTLFVWDNFLVIKHELFTKLVKSDIRN